jgi:hypothetical protein
VHHRLGNHLAAIAYGCAHYAQVRAALGSDLPAQSHPTPARHSRLHASHRKAGGRPEVLRRQSERYGLFGLTEGRPRHCP